MGRNPVEFKGQFIWIGSGLLFPVSGGYECRKVTIEKLRIYFAVSGFTPSVILVILGYVALLRIRASPWGLAVVALPGTFAHELAHFIIGLILRARPCGFSLWPRRNGKAWRLGAVTFRHVGILNGAFIALAPLLLLPLGWLSLMYLSVPAWANGHWVSWLGAGYLTATLFYACTPSFTDLKNGGRSLAVYLLMLALCWMMSPFILLRFQ